MGVEFICKGGFGGEANIDVELRTEFPGIGGMVNTYQGVVVANRREYSEEPKGGHKLFLKHSIIKKLEDYFFIRGNYDFAHVTRPLGSTDKTYIYEWAFGNEGFAWEYLDEENLNWYPKKLDDWGKFIGLFDSAGIDLQVDCTDADDGRISKNIIHQIGDLHLVTQSSLNRLWKRIDFGYSSIRVNYDKLQKFLKDNQNDLKLALNPQRYGFLKLATKYLSNKGKITNRDKGKLEVLTLDYRLSTLSHLNKRGIGDGLKGVTSAHSEDVTI